MNFDVGAAGRGGYRDCNTACSLQSIRDWLRTVRTIRSPKVQQTSEKRYVIGFVNPNAGLIAQVNNIRKRTFGSPRTPGADRYRAGQYLKTTRVARVARATKKFL